MQLPYANFWKVLNKIACYDKMGLLTLLLICFTGYEDP